MAITLKNSVLFVLLFLHVAEIIIPSYQLHCLEDTEAASLASQMMFAVLAIDHYVAIRYPFHHSEIMTTTLASGLIIAVWVITVVVYIYGVLTLVTTFRYIPHFAQCEATNAVAIAYTMRTLCLVALVIAINTYLYYKIIKKEEGERACSYMASLHG